MPPKPKSRSTGSARGDSGRAAILGAALHEFALNGPEGARTRAIAQRAGQNLATLHYHFGSKEDLYLALIESLTERFGSGMRGTIEAVAADLDRGTLTRAEACERFTGVLEAIFNLMVADERTMPLSRLIIREQMAPTAGFAIIFERVLQPVHTTLTRLLGIILGRDPEEPSVIAQTHCLIGQVLAFRGARATILRRTGWAGIGEAEAEIVRGALRANLAALFQGFDQTETTPSPER